MLNKKPISVILNWGQSNADGADGHGSDWVNDGSEGEILHRWSSGDPNLGSTGRSSFSALGPKGSGNTGFTPVLLPARSINAAAADNEKIAVIEAALGSTSISDRRPNNWLPDNGLYRVRILDFVRQSLRQLEDLGYAPRIDRMLCFQGESDAQPLYEDMWNDNFQKLIGRIKKEFDCPHMAIVICKTYSTVNDNTVVNQQQELAAATLPRCATIETSDVSREDVGDVHLDAVGMGQISPRIVAAFNSLL